MQTLLQDLRYGARMLLKKPGFALIAVLTLVLGVGANVAIFSVIYGVLLRALPFKDAERIVTLWEHNAKEGIKRDDVSPANFLDWRDRQQVFEDLAFANPFSFNYSGTGEPEVIQSALVSKNFFQILGVQALHGRTFLPEEYEAGKERVVLLSYGVWQQRFGGDPKIIGRVLTLDDKLATVIGVMPPEFKLHLFEKTEEMWGPQVIDESLRQQRRATYLKVIGRLKPGVTLAQARGELNKIAAQLSAEYPSTNAGIGIAAVTLPEYVKGKWRLALLVMFGAVGFVLLIACANIANLLLARGSERERELAIRAAIGAGRARLTRQLLTESLLLALLGCGGGVLLAVWLIDLLLAFNPGSIPRIEEVRLDGATLGFAALIAFVTALLFGLVPALQFSKPDLQSWLKESGQSVTAARHRLRSALVVAEIALALVLLVGAGLLLRSFVKLLNVDPGFAADRTVALQVFIWNKYREPQQREAYVKETLGWLETLPGVRAAGVTTALPLLDSSATTSLPITIVGRPAPPPGQEPVAQLTTATANFFPALGMRLLRGRLFNQFDTRDSTKVALINETLARRQWPNEDPVGKQFALRGRQGLIALEIVGVVSDLRQDSLDKEPRPEFFRPHTQSPSGSLIFVVRTAGDPNAVLASLKARIWQVNPTQPFYAVATLDQLVNASLKARRFNLTLLGSFAALALLLAVGGIYGVMSFTAGQRRHEIGIRMALGAQQNDVLKLIVGQGMKLTVTGLAIGLIAAAGLTRLMSGLLFGIGATDPLTFAAIALLLAVVALLACYIPARRAMKVDPLIALRYE